MSIVVARVTALKEETHNLMELKDLEDLVIRTMGEDTWNAIMIFMDEKIQEVIDDAADEIRGQDDSKFVALQSRVKKELDVIDKLIDKINEAKRLNKSSIMEELGGIHKRLYENEGY